MRCSLRNCKNVRDVDPISKLCPPCNTWFKDFNKRQFNNDRQQSAREDMQNQNRNLSSPGGASSASPPLTAPPPGSTSQAWARPPTAPPPAPVTTPPPPIDMAHLQNTYNQLKDSSTESPLLLDMFAVMLNIHSKQTETEVFRLKFDETIARMEAIEAKVGDAKEVAERLGLAVRFLPLPPDGYSDLDIVRQIFHEIRAPGIDVTRDIIKATRKIPGKPNYNSAQPVLGTVLVEMRNEEARSSIMKNKHTLHQHTDTNIANIIIKNMKSKEQMFMENLGNNILKRIPGCENAFISPNGQIRHGFQQSRYQNHQPPQQNRPGPHPNRSQYNNLQYNRPHFNTPQYNTPYFNTQNQHPHNSRNQSRPDVANHPYHHRHPQPRQFQTYQAHTVFDNNSSNPPAPKSSFPTPPPPVAVTQPQTAAPAPLQDLLSSLDTLYQQPPVPNQAGPDLHLLQQAEPHHGYAEQPQHQQPAQAWQDQQKDQVRDNFSDSE